MSNEQAIQFLQQGIAAAKAKQNDEARRLLQNAIRLDPDNETAWLWLSSVARDKQERVFCLRQILRINPQNEMALKGLRAMGVPVSAESGTPAAMPRSKIPRPPQEKLAAARQALGPILAELNHTEDPLEGIQWVHKRRNRAGERAAIAFSIAIRVVPLLIILGILAGGAYFISQNAEQLALAPTWTPSYTPTVTATPTPGFTPTPSATPRQTATPLPPIPQGLPEGRLDGPMTVTPPYPRFREGRIIQEAVMLMDAGEDAIALPTLSALRETLLESSDNPNPFYYEAVALANLGETEQAREVLQEGLERMEATGGDPGILHAGLAYVYALEGDYRASNEAAALALENDPELPQPYYTLIRNALAEEDFETANQLVAEALDRHPEDVNLWLLEGRMNLLRGAPDRALQDARIALHIDPTAEDAYLLQAEAAAAQGDHGLAVLYLQDYLFVYPGSIKGWTLLGDTRVLEGNIDLAIEAYSRAVNTETTEAAQIPALMARAALYTQRKQYEAAWDDYSRVLDFDEEHADARRNRAWVGYQAGQYGDALDDVDWLLDETPADASLKLLRARILVDSAAPTDEETYDETLDEVLNIIGGNFPNTLEGAERATAYEYRARIRLNRNEYQAALNDITAALNIQETGTRHYLRGLIHEARRELTLARNEYEWIRQWSRVYPYPFLQDVLERLEELAS
ncbi:MAG: hypothetical protein Kow0077_31610 [Anaerolineae bacterium]